MSIESGTGAPTMAESLLNAGMGQEIIQKAQNQAQETANPKAAAKNDGESSAPSPDTGGGVKGTLLNTTV